MHSVAFKTDAPKRKCVFLSVRLYHLTHCLSAAWTTCPYVRKDGKVNPDVRTLPGVGAIQHVSEAIHHNAIAFAIQKDAGFSKNVIRFVKAFFIDDKTRMNPHVNFGQIVRGPGPQGRQGTWTGILDLRGLVRILNGLSIMKASGSSDWDPSIDQAMNKWMSAYAQWLSNSPLGKDVASRPKSVFLSHNLFALLITIQATTTRSTSHKLPPQNSIPVIKQGLPTICNISLTTHSKTRSPSPGSSLSRRRELVPNTIVPLTLRL